MLSRKNWFLHFYKFKLILKQVVSSLQLNCKKWARMMRVLWPSHAFRESLHTPKKQPLGSLTISDIGRYFPLYCINKLVHEFNFASLAFLYQLEIIFLPRFPKLPSYFYDISNTILLLKKMYHKFSEI